MNDELKKKLEEAVASCADAASKASTALEALQYTQAGLNAANTLRCLTDAK